MGRGLTQRQKEVYDLRHSTDPPLSWEEIDRQLGMGGAVNARTRYKQAVENGAAEGAQVLPGRGRYDKQRLETKDPKKAAAVIDRLTDPLPDPIYAIARQEGVGKRAVENLEHRLSTEYLHTKNRLEVQKVQTQDLLGLCSDRAKRILDSISEEDIKKARLKDKTIAAAVLIDKRQLLSGEPTQILSVEDRSHINALLGAALQEAARRGVSFDLSGDSPRVIDVEPIPT